MQTRFITTRTTQSPPTRAASLHRRLLLKPVHSSIQTIFCAPRSVKSGSVPQKDQPASPRKKEGGGGGGGGLHAEQHFVYHRTLKVGDVLTAEVKPGKTWEKEGRRGGKLMFSETVTEYRDQNGELVITATGVGVRTERPATSDS